MSQLYVTEHGAVVGVEGGKLTIRHNDKTKEEIPKELVNGISIYGKSHLTAACVQWCLENGVHVSYFNISGRYVGCLDSIYKANTNRLRNQMILTENEDFSMNISRNIIHAKINNQYVVAKRYLKSKNADVKQELFHLRNARRKVVFAESRQQLMGYEGIASRNYFDSISKIIEEDFRFVGRSRRPAADPFNSMLNFGYSMLMKEIHGHLESKGLSAFAGFLHRDRIGHPSLASDMMEEWRAVIVDSTVLSMIQGHEVDISMFSSDNGYCKMSNLLVRLLLEKIERKMFTEMQYLSYIKKPLTFRQALWHQADKLAKSVDKRDAEVYQPIRIR